MDQTLKIILYSFCSGVTVFLGGLTSKFFERYKDHPIHDLVVHTSTAFGGGILIAAVALVLIPHGIKQLSITPLLVLFLMGGLAFCALDLRLKNMGGSLGQVMAMLMDFIPEALALGGVFAHNLKMGLLLAIFIGIQNYPESFNAYIELKKFNHSTGKTLRLLFILSFSGVVAALLGSRFLTDLPKVIAGIMVFAGSGIVYLMFQDVAPESKMKNKWLPAIAAVIGFLVGVAGQKLLG